jgi:hypothetical protein
MQPFEHQNAEICNLVGFPKRVFGLLVILKKRFNKMRCPCFLVKNSGTTSGINIYAYRAKESMPYETHILTLNFCKGSNNVGC